MFEQMHYGSYGGSAKSRYEYRIYVHKKDYSKSQAKIAD